MHLFICHLLQHICCYKEEFNWWKLWIVPDEIGLDDFFFHWDFKCTTVNPVFIHLLSQWNSFNEKAMLLSFYTILFVAFSLWSIYLFIFFGEAPPLMPGKPKARTTLVFTAQWNAHSFLWKPWDWFPLTLNGHHRVKNDCFILFLSWSKMSNWHSLCESRR